MSALASNLASPYLIPDDRTLQAIHKLPYAYVLKDFIRMMINPISDVRSLRGNLNCCQALHPGSTCNQHAMLKLKLILIACAKYFGAIRFAPNMIGFTIGFIKKITAKKPAEPPQGNANEPPQPGPLERLKGIFLQKLVRPVLCFGLMIFVAMRLFCFGLSHTRLAEAQKEIYKVIVFFLIAAPISQLEDAVELKGMSFFIMRPILTWCYHALRVRGLTSIGRQQAYLIAQLIGFGIFAMSIGLDGGSKYMTGFFAGMFQKLWTLEGELEENKEGEKPEVNPDSEEKVVDIKVKKDS